MVTGLDKEPLMAVEDASQTRWNTKRNDQDISLDLNRVDIGMAQEGGVMSPIYGDGDDGREIKNDYTHEFFVVFEEFSSLPIR